MPEMGGMSPAPAAGSNATVPAAAPPVVSPPGAVSPAVALPSVPNVRRRW